MTPCNSEEYGSELLAAVKATQTRHQIVDKLFVP